jgi:hypothetical protein
MMSDSKSSFWKSVITAAIAGLVVFSATSLYTDFWKKPHIMLASVDDKEKFQLKVMNIGRSDADKLRLTLEADPKIVNSYHRVFSRKHDYCPRRE